MAGMRPLSDQEIQDLLDYGFTGDNKDRDRAMFALGVSTGYRIGEIVQHKISDVMHRKSVKDVLKMPSRMRKGKGESQLKTLLPFAKRSIQLYIDRRAEQEGEAGKSHSYSKAFLNSWLFLSREPDRITGFPKPITTVRARVVLEQAFDKVGITGSVSTHSMRKTFAKKVYKQALHQFRTGQSMEDPMRSVQRHLGHQNINSTVQYMSFLSLDVDPSQFEFKVNRNHGAHQK